MRKLGKVFGVASLAASLVAMPAAAQMEAGDKSISIQGIMTTSDASSSATAFGGLNYYQTKNFAWRLNLLLTMTESGGTSNTFTNIGGGVEWNFLQAGAKTVPYVAFDLSQSIAEGFNQTEMAPSAGIRTFLNRNASFDTALAYRTALSSDDTSGGGTLDLRLGLSFYFGKDAKR